MKLFSDAPTRRLLARLSRGDRYGWVELVALILLATQLARLVWAIATPVGPYGDWRTRPLAIPGPAERQALFAGFDPFFRGADPAAAQAAVAVTPLTLTLFGVTVNQATGGGSAIIAGADGVQNSYVVGQEIEGGARLAGVAFDNVLIDRGGQREALYLDQDRAKAAADASQAANAQPAGGEGTMTPTPGPIPPPAPLPPPSGTPNAGLTPAALRAGIGFAPRAAGGQVTGVAVSPQGDGGVFRRAGLRPGDVIRTVNGQAIRSAADLARLQAQLAPGARLTLGVERGSGVANVALILDPQ